MAKIKSEVVRKYVEAKKAAAAQKDVEDDPFLNTSGTETVKDDWGDHDTMDDVEE